MTWHFSQTQKNNHAPEFTSSFSTLSCPPECRSDEVCRSQRPPTSAAASAATKSVWDRPCVPGSAPSLSHDEVPAHGRGMWRGARGRSPSATGQPPCPSPSRGWPSPTRRPPAHLPVTLLQWRLRLQDSLAICVESSQPYRRHCLALPHRPSQWTASTLAPQELSFSPSLSFSSPSHYLH